MKETETHCPACGSPLSPHAPAGFCARCALGDLLGPLPEPPADWATSASLGYPRPYGDYELLEEIARGGMGIVYKARHVELQRIVALKVIAAGIMASVDFVERFRNEATAAARLDHPNIISIHEIGEWKGELFFTMKWVDGETLAQYINRQWSGSVPDSTPLTVNSMRLVATLARAVHFAHQHGILHRDLKPNNVLLDKHGTPFLSDFGIAKLVEEESGITQTNAVLGTPSYMSPEQARGDTRNLTTVSDVYSLGAILYEMVTGRVPFSASTTFATIRQVIEDTPRPPSQINSAIDRDLATICLKCLEKEPENRYASAQALAEDLERLLNHEPIQARPVSAVERARKWIRRHPRRALLLGVTLSALVALIVVPSFMSLQLRKANRVAANQAEQNRRHLVRFNVSHGVELMNQGDMAGALPWFAEALELDRDHPDQVEIHRTRVGASLNHFPRLLRVVVHPGQTTSGGFSPDGNRVLFYTEDEGYARVIDITSGEDALPRLEHGDYIESAAFNRRGNQILTTSHDGTAQLWDAFTGHPAVPPFRHANGVNAAAISPDDRYVATCGFENTVKIWNAEDGKLQTSLDLPDRARGLSFSTDGTSLVIGCPQEALSWDWKSSTPPISFAPNLQGSIRGVLHHENSSQVLITTGHGIQLWNMGPNEPVSPAIDSEFWTFGAHFSPDDSTIMYWGRDGAVRFWKGDNQPSPILPLIHGGAVRDAAYSPNGRLIATASHDNLARLWDGDTGKLLCLLRHARKVIQVRFSPNGERLLTNDGEITRIWDLSKLSLSGPTLRVPQLFGFGFSKNGAQVMTVDANREIRAWDVVTGDELPLNAVEPDSPSPVLATTNPPQVIPHPDGRREAVITAGAVVIRDKETETRLTPPMRHRENIQIVSFSPDGRFLATASEDRTARVWETATGTPITPPLPYSATVTQAIFSQDGRRLGICTLNGQVEILDFTASQHDLDELRDLSSLLSNRQITSSGDLEDIDTKTLGDLQEKLEWSHSDWFTSSATDQARWRWREALNQQSDPTKRPAKSETESILNLLGGEPKWQGRYAIMHEDWDTAVSLATEALKSEAENVGLWRERSIALRHLSRYSEAIDDLSQAIKLDPSNALLWAERAQCHHASHQFDQAIADLNQAIALSPASGAFLTMRAKMNVERREWERALSDFARARELGQRLVPASSQADMTKILDRQEKASPNHVDLGSFFNGPVNDSWMVPWAISLQGGLSSLPTGMQEFGGVMFEIRGVVQLASERSRRRLATFPTLVEGIPLPSSCLKVHLLHGTDLELSTEETVGRVTIQYRDGTVDQIPIRNGHDIGAIFATLRVEPSSPSTVIAWRNDVSGSFRHQTLYRTTWINPHREKQLAMLNYVSTMGESGPALLAITVEP